VSCQTLAFDHGDVVVETDGIHRSFVDSLLLAAPPQAITEQAVGHRKLTEERLVFVVRYLR
jgi:hypothetical protein